MTKNSNRSRNAERRRRLWSFGSAGMPAIDLLWSYRRRRATELNIVKSARAAMAWRRVRREDIPRIAVRYLRWLYRFPRQLVAALIVSGPGERRRYGRSLIGQACDMIRIAAINELMPKDYYRAALARHSGGDAILNYVQPALVKAIESQLTAGGSGEKLRRLQDKSLFEGHCREAGLPVVRTIVIVQPTRVETPTGMPFKGALPDCDLIIKPQRGGRGIGIEGWRSAGPGLFVDDRGRTLPSDDLIRGCAERAEENGVAVLVQERLENHPDLRPIAGAALATTRVVTMRNESGAVEIVDSFYRTSITPKTPVDNFHNGGMLFPIDIATGMLRPGLTDAPFDPQPIVCHPETGARVAGAIHPGWREMTALALALHRLYPECLMPGWDIGFGPDGAVAIELNIYSGLSINRQPTFSGLVGTRTLQLLAFHCDRWLKREEPESSRWRPSRKPGDKASSSENARAT